MPCVDELFVDTYFPVDGENHKFCSYTGECLPEKRLNKDIFQVVFKFDFETFLSCQDLHSPSGCPVTYWQMHEIHVPPFFEFSLPPRCKVCSKTSSLSI